MEQQICLVSIVQAMHDDMFASSDSIYLIYDQAREYAKKLKVSHEEATNILNGMLSKFKSNDFMG